MKRLILILVSIFSIVFASQAAPTTFTVNSNTDAGAGAGTTGDLRYCINQAAATAVGPHTIVFNAAMTININSDLQITGGNLAGLTINGFTDATAGPDVIIRSSGVLNNKVFLNGASGVKIYGLVFDNLEYGVQMTNSTTCEVKGCYFGSNLGGSLTGSGIRHSGVFITSGGSANIIGGIGTIAGGGTTNSERCLFVKCMQVNTVTDQVRYGAILIEGSSSNQIVNNYFGVDITGTTKLGNGTQLPKMPLDHHNILIRNNNTANTVIDRNLIAGATGCGIYIENGPTGAVVKGNIIGLNAASTAKFANEACGIFMESTTGATIGGSTAIERNIISGNGGAAHNNYDDVCHFGWNDFNQYGIYAKNINGCTFKGNYIGTDATGNSSGALNILGNRAGGIKIVSQETGGGSANNIVGGSSVAGEGNVISGNGYNVGASSLNALCGAATASGIAGGPGITLQYGTCQNNTILGNSIGLGADGVTALGNSQEGISILGAANNKIGGSTPAEANFITSNLWGIMLQVDFACNWNGSACVNTATKASTGNIIVGNSIGIDKSGAAKGNGNRTGDNEGGGICLQMGSSGNFVGRNNSGEGNVIAGNRVGIVFRDGDNGTYGKGAAKNNFVYNNIIGDPTGGTSGNSLTPSQVIYGHGILMQVGDIGTTFPSGNTIGGVGANMRNYISGNQQSGILLHNPTAIAATTANSITGNFIGTTVTGLAEAGNTKNGIEIVNVSKTTIVSNLISGNNLNGISLTGSSTNTIQDNIIGSNISKTAPIPNGANGIALSGSSSNSITGNTISSNASNGIALSGSSTNTIQGNTISSNTSNGISLVSASANNIIGGTANTISNNGANGIVVDGAASIHNAIHQNSFSCNALRGIVLSAFGNNSYAAPTIVGTPSQLTFTGGVFIEVYVTDGCASCATGSSNRLQGKTLVASGNSPFDFTVALGFDKTKTYTALAHEAAGGPAHNTSEFSDCYSVCKDPTSVSITAGGPTTFCNGGSVTLTASIVDATGTVTYQWKNGSSNIVNATNSTYVATTSGTYTVVYNSDQACTANIASAVTTVTVNPLPLISDQTPAAICSGTAFAVTPSGTGVPAGTTYTWTAPVITGGLTGGSAQATGQTSISQTLVNPGTATGTAVYTVTPKSAAGCTGATFKITVTVNPTAIVATADPAAICSGATTAISLTSTTTSSTFAWTMGTASAGLSGFSAGSGASIAQTLINGDVAAGTVQYIITPTFGGCAGTAKTITVTVNPVAKVTTIDPAAICSGAATAINLTSSTASASFVWTIGTASSGVSGYSAGTGTSIAQTLVNNGLAAGTVQYIITPTFGGCLGTAKTITVTVNPVSTVTTADPAAICSGATTAISLTSGTTSSTFTWTIGTTSANVSGFAAGSGSSIAQTLKNTGTGIGAVQYVVTPTSGGCAGTQKTITVFVNPVSTVTTANPAAICSGATTAIGLTSGSSTATFTWTIGTATGVTGHSAGSGSNIAQTLTNNNATAGTVEYIVTPSVDGCDGTAKTITVTVNPVVTVTTTNPAVICSGSTTSIILASGTSPVTFAWTIGATSSGISGYAAGSGTTIAQKLTNSSSTTVGTVEYVVVPTFGTCAGTAKTITVSVNPVAILTTPNTASICSSSSTNIGLSSSIGSATYSWTIGSNVGTAGASAGNGSVIDQILTTTSPTVAGTVEYLVTATFGSCGGDVTKITVTVNPKPVTGITASGPTTFCTGGSAVLTATATGFTGGTFEWFQNGVSIGSENPKTVDSQGDFVAVYTTTGFCVSNNSNTISITVTPNTSEAVAKLDSVVTCLDNILLVAYRPNFGIGSWSIYSPNPSLPAELQSIPDRSSDSAQAVNLVNGVFYKFLYTVKSGCGNDQTDTVFVKVGVDDFGLTASAPSDTLCVETTRTMSAHVTGKGGSKNYNYVWVGSDGTSFTTKDSVIVVNPKIETIDYVVYVEDLILTGCKTNAVPLQIHAVASQDLNIPNLITPNGDNKNDIFYLADKNNGLPMIQEGSRLEIYNRWGNRVYEANNYDNTWGAKELSDGIYYYQVKSPCGNKEYKSWLQILGNTNN